MIVNAYSKINVGLAVKGKREDGFHEIDSYFVRTSLSDILEIDIKPSDELVIEIRSNVEYLDGSKPDLMEKAAKLYAAKSGKAFSIKIRVDKLIPSKAGLGGGSSDAASVLLALNKEFGAFSFAEIQELALSIGSDVPFFTSSLSLARIKGRGEIIEKAEGLDSYLGLIIFMPLEGVSTGNAYSYLDSIEREFVTLPSLTQSISKKDYPNDFERADDALVKKIEKAFPSHFVSLSGSGSAVYMLVKKGSDYEKLYLKAVALARKEHLELFPARFI